MFGVVIVLLVVGFLVAMGGVTVQTAINASHHGSTGHVIAVVGGCIIGTAVVLGFFTVCFALFVGPGEPPE